ncbi:MAG: ABC transporter permease subunit [Pseudomonadota bacterium]
MNVATAAAGGSNISLLGLWRDGKVRSVLFQIIALAVLFALFFTMAQNAIQNYAALDKTFGFDFLGFPSGYDIAQNQAFIEYSSVSPHWKAVLIGIMNTANVAFWGVIAATLLGVVFGVLRLSSNWLVSRVVYCWIEFARNVPVLLQILFWQGIFNNVLPPPRDAINIADRVFIMNRGINIPEPIAESWLGLTLIAFIIGIVVSIFYSRNARKVQEQTGEIKPVMWVSLALIIALPLLVFLASSVIIGAPVRFEAAVMGTFNLQGGMQLASQFMALWFALSLYTAAFIAEIVRAGILAVDHGQTEAAHALGLRPGRTLRLVVLPQAMRIIIPPLANQFLNLTKNSSLAIAIGYYDIVATLGGITLSQTGKEMECMIMVMLIYLCFSLLISMFMNWYNRRVSLVTR